MDMKLSVASAAAWGRDDIDRADAADVLAQLAAWRSTPATYRVVAAAQPARELTDDELVAVSSEDRWDISDAPTIPGLLRTTTGTRRGIGGAS